MHLRAVELKNGHLGWKTSPGMSRRWGKFQFSVNCPLNLPLCAMHACLPVCTPPLLFSHKCEKPLPFRLCMLLRWIFTCSTFSLVAHLEISLFWTGYALVIVFIYGLFDLDSSLCGCYFAPLCPCWVTFSVSFELYVHGCLQASVDTIMKEKMPKKGGRWWFSWRSRNSDSKSVSRLTHRYCLSLSFFLFF